MVARLLLLCCALVVAMGSSGRVLAQPFRAQIVPPDAPSPEAQRAFQATIDAQAQLLARDRRFKGVPGRQQQALIEFVVGNLLFAANHELGLAFLSEKSLPALVGPERAADDFAVLAALELGRQSFSDRILIEAAKGWFASVRRKASARGKPDYYDQHQFGERRAYRLVCLMVGADAARFKALAEETALPHNLQRDCGWDYDRALRSWDTALAPHRPSADQPKAKIDVIYGAATGNLEVYAHMFRSLRFLETIAEYATNRLAWRAPLTMEMRSCGDTGATWSAATRALKICYEMAEDFAMLYRDLGRGGRR